MPIKDSDKTEALAGGSLVSHIPEKKMANITKFIQIQKALYHHIPNKTSVYGTPSQIPAFDLTKASAKFEVATSNGLGGDAFTRKYIISLLTLTLGQEQTRKVAQCPLHHMTYAPAKFEASMSNGLGGNAFKSNI